MRARAPGRVNLMGNHVDFQDGFVLPVALQLETQVDFVPADRVRLTSQYGPPVDIAADGSEAAEGWAGYVSGVVAALADRHRPAAGIEGSVTTTVPLGAGLSSSASLTVALTLALNAAAGMTLPPLNVADVARRAEHVGTGVACGIMDPLIAAVGSPDGALLIDCLELTVEAVAIPDELAVIVADSGAARSLGTSGWTERKADVHRGVKLLDLPSLRHATRSEVESLPDPYRRRCRHVLTEMGRTLALAEALPKADRAGIAELFAASHRSDVEDYEAGHPAVDELVDRLNRDPRVIGARMTGGGFGGMVVAIVEGDAAAAIVDGLPTRAWSVEPSPGASVSP